MIRVLALSIVLCSSAIAPAAATARCNQPYAPQIPDGAAATASDIQTARRDATAFIAASDLYQECLARSAHNESRIVANQREKERVGRAFNEAVAAFNARNRVQVSSR